jgi:NDP-sugar pyrophosphorylase family protein
VFLVRGGCLSAIPEVGFVDFKEQAIPLIAKRHSVKVAELAGECGVPVRSLHDYVQAVRYHVARQQQGGGTADEGFSVIEPGAHVDASARLHDSIVLSGSRAGAGAIVAGSLVTSTGVVGKGRRVLHSVVTGARSSWSAWA